MLSSLSFNCWFAMNNYVANFVGGRMGGMGFFELFLHWGDITSSVMRSPYRTCCVKFAAFNFSRWILITAAKRSNFYLQKRTNVKSITDSQEDGLS